MHKFLVFSWLLFLLIPLLAACQAEASQETITIQAPATSMSAMVTLTPYASVTPESLPTLQPEALPTDLAVSRLIIYSNLPEAIVSINQAQVGHTPYEDVLPAGTYTVTVSLPGFQTWQQQVDLTQTDTMSLTADLVFTPKVEQLLTVCVDSFWWSENGDTVYYIECGSSGFKQLDLSTSTVSQADNVWPSDWVPKQYQALVPASIPSGLISVSPSGEKIIFLEETDAPLQTPQPGFPAFYIPEYTVNIIDNGTITELGIIDSLPDTISWAQDEQVIFISSYAATEHNHEGWLINLKERGISALSPPEESDQPAHLDFINASILPDGESILYRPLGGLNDFSHVWNFRTNQERILSVVIGRYYWLTPDRYLVFLGLNSDSEIGLYWYDLSNDIPVPILSNDLLPTITSWRLSPQNDRLLFTQSDSGVNMDGLWLLTLDTQ